jgi:hypothetical protein
VAHLAWCATKKVSVAHFSWCATELSSAYKGFPTSGCFFQGIFWVEGSPKKVCRRVKHYFGGKVASSNNLAFVLRTRKAQFFHHSFQANSDWYLDVLHEAAATELKKY